jgi:hypothetical protein
MNEKWVNVNVLNRKDFMDYLETLPEDDRAEELKEYSQREGELIVKEDMKLYDDFYSFISAYSPRDYKNYFGLKYVSQRVIATHVEYWNEIHPTKIIKTLRVFFI